jgi:hypothetical protein
MSTHDDDDIEFDFFDEPQTVEQGQRRRLPRLERPGGRGGGDGPRQPLRAPTGLVPLARLVGLIAIAIVVVVGLVFWVGSCQGKSKHDEYQSYANKVKLIAQADQRRGQKFADTFISPGLKRSDLANDLQQWAQQEQEEYAEAQQIRPPGPLRAAHQNVIDALELRAKGLGGLGDVVARADATKDASKTAAALTDQGSLLTASDVVWAQLYKLPATQVLHEQNVKGVVIPSSQLVANTDTVSARAFQILMTRLGGASTGGTPSGKHGDGIVSVQVTPAGTTLATDTPTTVKVSPDLAFVATVENSGDFQETAVPVTLTINAGGKPIVKKQTIPLIGPGERQTVKFTSFDLPSTAFGTRATVRVVVGKVPGEVNLDNNSATYTVFFTLS